MLVEGDVRGCLTYLSTEGVIRRNQDQRIPACLTRDFHRFAHRGFSQRRDSKVAGARCSTRIRPNRPNFGIPLGV